MYLSGGNASEWRRQPSVDPPADDRRQKYCECPSRVVVDFPWRPHDPCRTSCRSSRDLRYRVCDSEIPPRWHVLAFGKYLPIDPTHAACGRRWSQQDLLRSFHLSIVAPRNQGQEAVRLTV